MVRMLPEELPLIHPFRPWEKRLDDNHERLELSFTESGNKLNTPGLAILTTE